MLAVTNSLTAPVTTSPSGRVRASESIIALTTRSAARRPARRNVRRRTRAPSGRRTPTLRRDAVPWPSRTVEPSLSLSRTLPFRPGLAASDLDWSEIDPVLAAHDAVPTSRFSRFAADRTVRTLSGCNTRRANAILTGAEPVRSPVRDALERFGLFAGDAAGGELLGAGEHVEHEGQPTHAAGAENRLAAAQ